MVLRTHPPSAEPSLVLTGSTLPRRALGRLPLLHIESLPCVLPPLPRWNRRSNSSLYCDGDLPRYCGGSASTLDFRGLLGVHCALQPARPADSLRSRFLECFSPFVTSWTTPSASGWDEHRRSGFAPEDSTCLFKAHTMTNPNGSYDRWWWAAATGCSSATPTRRRAGCRWSAW